MVGRVEFKASRYDECQNIYLYFRLHEIGVNVVVLSSTDSNVNSDKASLKCLASR